VLSPCFEIAMAGLRKVLSFLLAGAFMAAFLSVPFAFTLLTYYH
jgi:hypothetical protein